MRSCLRTWTRSATDMLIGRAGAIRTTIISIPKMFGGTGSDRGTLNSSYDASTRGTEKWSIGRTKLRSTIDRIGRIVAIVVNVKERAHRINLKELEIRTVTRITLRDSYRGSKDGTGGDREGTETVITSMIRSRTQRAEATGGEVRNAGTITAL